MKIKLLQERLEKGQAFLISSPENRRYATGFQASDGWLLITESEAVLLMDSRYIEAAQSCSQGCLQVVLLKSLSQQLPEYLTKLGVKRVFTEARLMSVADYNMIKKLIDCECLAERLDEALTELRRAKSDEEKRRVAAAQAIAEKAFDSVLGFIKEGVTEREIALELDFFMLRHGAECVSFETIAVSGRNSSLPHGVPSDKRVECGDFITMDFGAVVDGYHSDMTRTVAVGQVSAEQMKIYETVLLAQQKGLDALRAGVECKAADSAARKVINEAGYGEFFGHGTGHGVAIEIHEEPRLSPKSEQTLKIGDIVTVEPGIYLPGKFGVRIEDMAIITENGCENLTKAPKSLIII